MSGGAKAMPQKSQSNTSIRKGMMWGIMGIIGLPVMWFVDIGMA
jgi:hypothetical protein